MKRQSPDNGRSKSRACFLASPASNRRGPSCEMPNDCLPLTNSPLLLRSCSRLVSSCSNENGTKKKKLQLLNRYQRCSNSFSTKQPVRVCKHWELSPESTKKQRHDAVNDSSKVGKVPLVRCMSGSSRGQGSGWGSVEKASGGNDICRALGCRMNRRCLPPSSIL